MRPSITALFLSIVLSTLAASAQSIHVSSKPKVTCETITDDSRKESRRPNPIAECCILSEDDFGRRQLLGGRSLTGSFR
jgi:hypothetical protein